MSFASEKTEKKLRREGSSIHGQQTTLHARPRSHLALARRVVLRATMQREARDLLSAPGMVRKKKEDGGARELKEKDAVLHS